MRESFEGLVQVSTDTMQLVANNISAIRSMQTEVSGLQVDNRRILRELRDLRRDT
ncbi:MAG: hypothetical protein IGS48_16485 [Oscillatoriales cyanobacterium C42_A2020_001]|nr:hypothetical protein [Leptolyngbyaceae cyanobacterium C42_A2020_001]